MNCCQLQHQLNSLHKNIKILLKDVPTIFYHHDRVISIFHRGDMTRGYDKSLSVFWHFIAPFYTRKYCFEQSDKANLYTSCLQHLVYAVSKPMLLLFLEKEDLSIY